MPVIAIVNQKGGTGKTTLSTNLACAFAGNSAVLLLDADAQGSSQDWADIQGQGRINPQVIAAGAGTLLQDARRAAGQFDWVIIDGPSGISGTTADAIRAADVVLIPAKASPFDVWAAADIVAAVRARQESTGGSPRAAFVVTMSRHRTLLGRQVESALEEYGLPATGGPHHRAGVIPADCRRGEVGPGRQGPDRAPGDQWTCETRSRG